MRRLAQFVRLRASRVCLSLVCVRLRLRLSRVCICLASACICLACVSRLSASVHVKGSECVRLHLSRICLASVSHLSRVCLASVVLSRVCASASVSRLSRVCVRLSRVCLASVVLSRVCLSPCECLRELAHFMSVVIQRV